MVVPVPIVPANSFADQTERANPYPYSVSAATGLLKSHGWTINANGTDTCSNPGTAANQCGKGIASGAQLTFNLQYASGVQATTQMMDAFKSAAAQAGITINLTTAPFDQVIGNAVTCTASQAACKWQMQNWGGGWVYSPDFYPTGGELFQTGAGANFGNYTDPTADSLIQATHTAPASQTQSALDAYQNYIVKSLPVVFQPNADYQLSEVSSTLHGVQQNAFGYLTPEAWYFTK